MWVFYRNMRPLYVLLHWLDKYRIGKVNEPLQNNTRVSEFRKLNEAAVRYAERSEQMFEQQNNLLVMHLMRCRHHWLFVVIGWRC